MPNATTVAPDGATISIRYTGTPPSHEMMAAAVANHMKSKEPSPRKPAPVPVMGRPSPPPLSAYHDNKVTPAYTHTASPPVVAHPSFASHTPGRMPAQALPVVSAAPSQTFAQQAHLPTSVGQWLHNVWDDQVSNAKSAVGLPGVILHTAGDIGASLGHGIRGAYRRTTGDRAGAAQDTAVSKALDDRTGETIKSAFPFHQQIKDYGTALADKYYNVHYDPNRADGMQDGIGNDLRAANAHLADLAFNRPVTFAANTAAIFGLARGAGIVPEAAIGRVRAASAEASLNADRLTVGASRAAAQAAAREAAGDVAGARMARAEAARQTVLAAASKARSLKFKRLADASTHALHTASAPSRAVAGAVNRALTPAVRVGAKAAVRAAVRYPKAAGVVQDVARGVSDRAEAFRQGMQTPLSVPPLASAFKRPLARGAKPAARPVPSTASSDLATHNLAASILSPAERGMADLHPIAPGAIPEVQAPGDTDVMGSHMSMIGRTPSPLPLRAVRRPSSRPMPPPTMRAYQAAGRASLNTPHGSFIDIHADTLTPYARDLINNGVDEFAPWATAMVRKFGKGVRPHLTTLFDETHKVAGQVDVQGRPLEPTIYAWQKRMDANGNVGYLPDGLELIPANPRGQRRQPGADERADWNHIAKRGGKLTVLQWDRAMVGLYDPRDPNSGIKIHLKGGGFLGAYKPWRGKVMSASGQGVTRRLNKMSNEIPNLYTAYSLGTPEMSVGDLDFTRAYDAELQWSIYKGEVDSKKLDAAVFEHANHFKPRRRALIQSWQDYVDLALKKPTSGKKGNRLTYGERQNFLKALGHPEQAKTGASIPYNEVLDGFNGYHDVPQDHIVAIAEVKPGQEKAMTANQLGVLDHSSYDFFTEGDWEGITDPIHAHAVFGPEWKKTQPKYTADNYQFYAQRTPKSGVTNVDQSILDIVKKHRERRKYYNPSGSRGIRPMGIRGTGNRGARSVAKKSKL